MFVNKKLLIKLLNMIINLQRIKIYTLKKIDNNIEYINKIFNFEVIKSFD